jgi:serine/threonine protein kinase/WD40 repeat protein
LTKQVADQISNVLRSSHLQCKISASFSPPAYFFVGAPVSASSPDHTLLIGLLAQLNQFVRREQLLEALSEWKHNKSRSLVDILSERGLLSAERRQLLEALAAELIAQTGDVAQSLATLSSVDSVRDDIRQVHDSELTASIERLPPTAAWFYDPNHTLPPTAVSNLPDTAKGLAAARFRVLRFHARGGLGQVSLAVDEELGREVALKEIQSQRADDPVARERFIREAEITGQLEHPGIVPVYGLGTYADGRPYYAMRFIEGDNLLKHVQTFHKQGASHDFQSADFRRLLARFIDVCQAIQYAHDRKVLHRDLKPENIMLGKYGETLVVDWGLAKATNAGHPELTVAGDKSVMTKKSGSNDTLEGSTFGTPAYMSPEQAGGRISELDKATDIYSLGATLYCLLTGHPPFRSKDHSDVLQAVQQGRFSNPRVQCSAVPRALESICLKAMSREPAQRYATATALASDLEQWLADSPVVAHRDSLLERASRFVRRYRAWVLGGGALLAAIAIALAIGLFAVRQEQLRTLAAQKTTQLQLAESERDRGLQLCRTGDVDEGLHWLCRSLENTPLDADDLKRSIRWNIASWQQQLCKLEQQLTIPADVRFGGLSPDGRWMLLEKQLPPPPGYVRRDGDPDETHSEVHVCRFPSGERVGQPLPRVWVRRAQFSPDSKRLVLTRIADKRHRGLVFRLTKDQWELETTPVEINTHAFMRPSFQFLPDGRLLTFEGDEQAKTTLEVREVSSGKVLGKVPARARSVLDEKSLRFSDSGELVMSKVEKKVTLWKVATGEPNCPPLDHRENVELAALSPAGDRVATAWQENRDVGFVQYWNASTGAKIGGPIRLGEDSYRPAFLEFRAQGEQLFVATVSGSLRVFDLTGKPLAPPLRSVFLDPVEVSSDGKLAGFAGRLWDVGAVRPLGQELPSVRFSADDRHVIATINNPHVHSIQRWSIPAQGSICPPIRRGNPESLSLLFSPDSKRFLRISVTEGTAQIWNARTGEPLGEEWHGPYGIQTPVLTDSGLVAFGSFANDDRPDFQATHLFNAQTGQAIKSDFPKDQKQLRALALDPQQKRLAAVGDDGVIWIYDIALGKTVAGPWKHEIPEFYHRVHLRFSRRGDVLAVTNNYYDLPGARLSLWDLSKSKQIGETQAIPASLQSIDFHPDGSQLAAVGKSETFFFDCATAQPRLSKLVFANAARHGLFDPASGQLVTAHVDNTVRFWNPTTCQSASLPLHTNDTPSWLSVSSMRSLLFVGGIESASVWDLGSRTQIGPDYRPATTAQMSPDGRTIAAIQGSEIRLWDIPNSASEETARLREAIEAATGKRMTPQRSIVPLSKQEWQRLNHQ